MSEVFMGRIVTHNSPAHVSKRKPPQATLEAAMREVHNDEPSTVTRAKHFGPGGKEAMLEAIAFKKARRDK